MRRLGLIGLLVALATAVALGVSALAQGSDSYTFDVIFDDARGLISGQQVKIAGAKAGTISDVTVSDGDKARVEAQITGPFQFHTDASCIIRPDGLIAENYLDCDPGSPGKPLLKAKGSNPPTVPVTQTSEPVSLQDLFDIFNVPTAQRFQALINELGISTAGDGDDINAILRRANPTLQLAQNVIAILDRQTAQISTAIDATDAIARAGVTRTAAVHNFLQQASALTQLTANHSSTLEQAINRLPGLLSAAQPALAKLNTVATDGTPLLASLRAATPALNRVDSDIVPFTKLAQPALASLAGVISTSIPTAKKATPLIRTVDNYLKASGPDAAKFAALADNLVQHGFSEGLMSVFYYVASGLSKYDSNSHMLSSLLVFPDNGGCAFYATTPSSSAECQGHYTPQNGAKPARVAKRKPAKHAAKPAATTTSSTAAPTTTTSTGTGTGTNPLSNVGKGLSNLTNTVGGTVNKVLGGVTTTANGISTTITKALGGLLGQSTTQSNSTTQSGTGTSTTTTTGSLQGLLNYLLK